MFFKGKYGDNACIWILIHFDSVCLPPVIIPIVKLSSAAVVMSSEFKLSRAMHIVSWMLTVVIIGFNIFLFVSHVTGPISLAVFIILGSIYVVRYDLHSRMNDMWITVDSFRDS